MLGVPLLTVFHQHQSDTPTTCGTGAGRPLNLVSRPPHQQKASATSVTSVTSAAPGPVATLLSASRNYTSTTLEFGSGRISNEVCTRPKHFNVSDLSAAQAGRFHQARRWLDTALAFRIPTSTTDQDGIPGATLIESRLRVLPLRMLVPAIQPHLSTAFPGTCFTV